MKTMRKGSDITRVKDSEEKKFLGMGYNYCPKKVWKDEVRVIKQKKEEIREILDDEQVTKKGKKSKKG
jgi:hypothetical protein